jgi:uncharacterized protein (TIGR02646 family)
MRRLDRMSVTDPPCLRSPVPESRYGQLKGHEKQEIRDALLQMQGHRCAYCERRTGFERDEGHIEHFCKQVDCPELQLTWSNMLWSCIDERSCGKHKDKCDRPVGSGPQASFSSDDLLNPCNEDPDEFLDFLADGTVRPRAGLTASDTRRAQESLRVFQLDASAFLRQSRKDAVSPYMTAIDVMLKHGDKAVKDFVASARPVIEAGPFSAAIRHYLRGL